MFVTSLSRDRSCLILEPYRCKSLTGPNYNKICRKRARTDTSKVGFPPGKWHSQKELRKISPQEPWGQRKTKYVCGLRFISHYVFAGFARSCFQKKIPEWALVLEVIFFASFGSLGCFNGRTHRLVGRGCSRGKGQQLMSSQVMAGGSWAWICQNHENAQFCGLTPSAKKSAPIPTGPSNEKASRSVPWATRCCCLRRFPKSKIRTKNPKWRCNDEGERPVQTPKNSQSL